MPISQVKPEALATLPTSTSTAGAGPTPSAFAQSYQAASEAAWGAVEGQKQKAGQALKVGYGPEMWGNCKLSNQWAERHRLASGGKPWACLCCTPAQLRPSSAA